MNFQNNDALVFVNIVVFFWPKKLPHWCCYRPLKYYYFACRNKKILVKRIPLVAVKRYQNLSILQEKKLHQYAADVDNDVWTDKKGGHNFTTANVGPR